MIFIISLLPYKVGVLIKKRFPAVLQISIARMRAISRTPTRLGLSPGCADVLEIAGYGFVGDMLRRSLDMASLVRKVVRGCINVLLVNRVDEGT